MVSGPHGGSPNQRSKIGKKPGQSLNLHPSWCRFIKIRSHPPGECNAIRNRSSLHHHIRGPGHHAPWRCHPPPGMPARLRVLRDLPRARAKAQDRTRRRTRHRTQGWHDGRMILAITLMTIIAPPCHHGQGPGRRCGQAGGGHRSGPAGAPGRAGPPWPVQEITPQALPGGRGRTFPSPRSILEWLEEFHDDAAGREREAGTASIPEPSPRYTPLRAVRTRLPIDHQGMGPPSGGRGSRPSPSPSRDEGWGRHHHPHRQEGCQGDLSGRRTVIRAMGDPPP